MKKGVNKIVGLINKIKGDPLTPSSINEALDKILKILKDNSDIDLKLKKCLDILEEVGEDPNLSIYARSQLWHLVGSIESVLNQH